MFFICRSSREGRLSSRGDSSREREGSDHHDDLDGRARRRSNRRRSPLSQERSRGERGGGDEYFERGSQEEAVRGRESSYGKQTLYHDHSNKEREREKGGSRPHHDRDRGDDRGGYYRR